jgi:hypothetical protein
MKSPVTTSMCVRLCSGRRRIQPQGSDVGANGYALSPYTTPVGSFIPMYVHSLHICVSVFHRCKMEDWQRVRYIHEGSIVSSIGDGRR